MRDAASLAHVVTTTRPELVIHQAAFTHVGKSFSRIDENIQINIQGTVNLLLSLDGNYDRFVNIGSGDVYGDAPVPFREDGPIRPASPYAVSKYAAERFCRMFHQAYGWPIVCLRPFNVYGPQQSPDRIIPELIISGLTGKDLEMTGAAQTREFMYVDDVADVFVRALTQPGIEGEVINVSRGEEVSDPRARPDRARAHGQPGAGALRRPALPPDRDLAHVRRQHQGPRAPRVVAHDDP